MDNINKVIIVLEFDELLCEDRLHEAIDFAVDSFKQGYRLIVSTGYIAKGFINIETEEE